MQVAAGASLKHAWTNLLLSESTYHLDLAQCELVGSCIQDYALPEISRSPLYSMLLRRMLIAGR